MENNIDTSYGIEGYAILILTVAFFAYAVYYCKKVAKELKMNETIAVLAGLLLPLLALLIYSHLNYKAKKKHEASSTTE